MNETYFCGCNLFFLEDRLPICNTGYFCFLKCWELNL